MRKRVRGRNPPALVSHGRADRPPWWLVEEIPAGPQVPCPGRDMGVSWQGVLTCPKVSSARGAAVWWQEQSPP